MRPQAVRQNTSRYVYKSEPCKRYIYLLKLLAEQAQGLCHLCDTIGLKR